MQVGSSNDESEGRGCWADQPTRLVLSATYQKAPLMLIDSPTICEIRRVLASHTTDKCWDERWRAQTLDVKTQRDSEFADGHQESRGVDSAQKRDLK